jgi:hypothetical protein
LTFGFCSSLLVHTTALHKSNRPHTNELHTQAPNCTRWSHTSTHFHSTRKQTRQHNKGTSRTHATPSSTNFSRKAAAVQLPPHREAPIELMSACGHFSSSLCCVE